MRRLRVAAAILAATAYAGWPAAGQAQAAAGNPGSAAWKHGRWNDPTYFPIAVWLQSPSNAARYKAAGVNLFVGLWQGPTEQQLAELRSAGMPVVCEQNAVGLRHLDSATIVGWMHGDEPDNAQEVTDPATGNKAWGPCVPPGRIVADYERLRKADPSRPIMLNLGQGVANDQWLGRGPGAKLEDYETYVKGCDFVSYDVYPVAGLERPDGDRYIWYLAKGLDRLAKWTGGGRRIWNCIECSRISSDRKVTPEQLRSEVWMSIIHGSTGIIYFTHQFKPTFKEWAILEDADLLPTFKAVNQQIAELASVLNSPTVRGVVSVSAAQPDVPIDIMVKRSGGSMYVFAVGMRSGTTAATFTLPAGLSPRSVDVVGENRALPVRAGTFHDDFGIYGVHIYKCGGRPAR